MPKPSWWLLAAGIAHPCSAVAGFVLGAGAADKAYKLYNKRLIIYEENRLSTEIVRVPRMYVSRS